MAVGRTSFSAGLPSQGPTGFPWTCLVISLCHNESQALARPKRDNTKSVAKTLLHLRYKTLRRHSKLSVTQNMACDVKMFQNMYC
jgi:hypothetical protein